MGSMPRTGWDIPLERGSGAPTKSLSLARNFGGKSRVLSHFAISWIIKHRKYLATTRNALLPYIYFQNDFVSQEIISCNKK